LPPNVPSFVLSLMTSSHKQMGLDISDYIIKNKTRLQEIWE
jgi:hypothetical protein